MLDMSGSMGSVRNATVEGCNSYIHDLQEDEKAETTRLSLIAFDDYFEVWHEDMPVAAIPPVGDKYTPRGMTALNDAIAKTIALLDNKLQGDRADEKVLVVVLTDGLENASKEYSRGSNGICQRLVDLVETYEARGNWTFVYMGANDRDVVKTATEMGMQGGNAAFFSATAGSVGVTMDSLSHVTRTRKGAATGQSASSFADAAMPTDYRDESDKPEEKKK